MLCYKLVYTNSGAQPFILEPRDSFPRADPAVACSDLGKMTLKIDQMLVVAIDARDVDIRPLKILNINLVTQQGSPVNPAPIRPSFSPSVRSRHREDSIYYLAWPNRLAGDVVPTLSINAVYTPPAPGAVRENDTFYPAGSIVTTGDSDGRYFLTQKGGVTSHSPPAWNRGTPPTVADGRVRWQLIGPVLPAGLQAKPWAPAPATFHVGDVVISPTSLNYYIVVSSDGATGQALPQFPLSPAAITSESGPAAPPVTWVDIGMVPPGGIIPGQQAPDQTVNLLTLQLPQTHSLSYFNLAAGVVYSSVHSRTYAVPSGSKTTDLEVETSSTPTIEPVLSLTVYPWPVDAESRCGWHCLWTTPPGVSAGFSLASPSNSFYVGASFEIFRNIQVVAGWNWAKEASKPDPAVAISDSATSAVTVQRFSSGPFLGLTFNVSGFVQGIVGGGGSKSSSGQ